jgi:hypothetical protein
MILKYLHVHLFVEGWHVRTRERELPAAANQLNRECIGQNNQMWYWYCDMDRKSHACTVLHDAKAMRAAGYSYAWELHAHGWSHHIGVFGKVEEGIVWIDRCGAWSGGGGASSRACDRALSAAWPGGQSNRAACVRVLASSDMIRSICSLDFAFVMYCVWFLFARHSIAADDHKYIYTLFSWIYTYGINMRNSNKLSLRNWPSGYILRSNSLQTCELLPY